MAKEINTDAIREELLKLGIPPQFRAFEWLTRAVFLCSQDKKLRENPTGQLYELIAQEYNTEATIVLQAIRRAVRAAWENCNNYPYPEFNKVFEYYKSTKPPTSLEFVTRISDYLSKEED